MPTITLTLFYVSNLRFHQLHVFFQRLAALLYVWYIGSQNLGIARKDCESHPT